MSDALETTIDSAAPLAVAHSVRETLRAAMTAALAPATRRAYSGAWDAWASWAEAHGADTLPAAPEAVAAYLAARFESGAGMATLRLAVAAIAAAHRLAGSESPCRDRAVTAAMRGFARTAAEAGKAARQAKGLSAEAVAAIRGSMNGRADTASGALTMALV